MRDDYYLQCFSKEFHWRFTIDWENEAIHWLFWTWFRWPYRHRTTNARVITYDPPVAADRWRLSPDRTLPRVPSERVAIPTRIYEPPKPPVEGAEFLAPFPMYRWPNWKLIDDLPPLCPVGELAAPVEEKP